MLWRTFTSLAPYAQTVADMRALCAAIRAGHADESIWLLEHPPLYTAGTSARPGDLINPSRFTVHHSKRGGKYTYHGPGQRVIYVMLDLRTRAARGQAPDLRRFVHTMEQWLIDTLSCFDIKGERRSDRIGVWVKTPPRGNQPGTERKIAALGVQVSQGITSHGASINLNPDLTHYDGIVPCGIRHYGVTSLEDLSVRASLADLDAALKASIPPALSRERARL